MLEELRRCNSIGNKAGLEFLIRLTQGKDFLIIDEIKRLSSLRNDVKLKCDAAVAFFVYLDLVDIATGCLQPTELGNELFSLDVELLHQRLCFLVFKKMIDEGIFDEDAFIFDEESGSTLLRRWAIPLSHAALRNYLIDNEALISTSSGEIVINPGFERLFKNKIGKRRRKMSIEQLLKIKEAESLQGAMAEEFVLEFEKRRLSDHVLKDKIQKISDFDIGAGYDIASYANTIDLKYNRFIEVKSFVGEPHFYWSDNEVDVAKLKGDNYFLCLVDMQQINEPGYEPNFIQNPINEIFNGEKWLVCTSNYRIKSV